jgi:hypothetical protein
MTPPIDPTASYYCEQTEDHAELHGPGLRLAFARTGAVWTHAISVSDEHGLELVRTVESDPDRDHPGRVVSPVYQELQRHHDAAGSSVCLLATGTFYRHHFSAVITLKADPDRQGGLMLDVDVADRCRAVVESLAATYTVRLDSGALAGACPEAITWEIAGGSAGRLELEAVAPSTLVLAEGGRSATRVQILAAILPGGFTHRLHYRWRWASNSGLTR